MTMLEGINKKEALTQAACGAGGVAMATMGDADTDAYLYGAAGRGGGYVLIDRMNAKRVKAGKKALDLTVIQYGPALVQFAVHKYLQNYDLGDAALAAAAGEVLYQVASDTIRDSLPDMT